MTDRHEGGRRARITLAGAMVAALLWVSPLQAQAPAASCESLTLRALPSTAITLAQIVVPGAFQPGLPVPEEGKVVRTRPLCPYPQVARCKGTGSTNEAANFVCR